MNTFITKILKNLPAKTAYAHCDGPCGVYDPASARIAAEAVVSMTKKLSDLDENSDPNNYTRYVLIKEEQAQIAKDEVLILWTDYFKPKHLDEYPDLHDLVWKTAKLCSESKQHVDQKAADQLLENVKKIHDIFWKTKGRDIEWYTAS